MGNHWLDSTGKIVINDNGRSPVLNDVNPGDEVVMCANSECAKCTGDYILEIDMLQEGVSWFGLRGSKTLRIPITVKGSFG